MEAKVEFLEAQFDQSITPDAILDLSSVKFLENTGEGSNSRGVLIANINGTEGTVCDRNNINESAANLFCEMLGFKRAWSVSNSGLSQGKLKSI